MCKEVNTQWKLLLEIQKLGAPFTTHVRVCGKLSSVVASSKRIVRIPPPFPYINPPTKHPRDKRRVLGERAHSVNSSEMIGQRKMVTKQATKRQQNKTKKKRHKITNQEHNTRTKRARDPNVTARETKTISRFGMANLCRFPPTVPTHHPQAEEQRNAHQRNSDGYSSVRQYLCFM